MNLKRVKLGLLGLLLSFGLAGCMSTQKLDDLTRKIREKHGVEVVAKNPLSRTYLFGNLPGLLNRIDKDLEKCPEYFKENLGSVMIEEWFFDNLDVYKEIYPPILLRGYVNPDATDKRYPIHIKNRSLIEKILLFGPRDSELFSHEAAHSFAFNAIQDKYVAERFATDWVNSGVNSGEPPHFPYAIKGAFYIIIGSVFPPVLYIRTKGVASLWGLVHPLEDMAETHCYLLRHNTDEKFWRKLEKKDKVFYKKCKAWESFINRHQIKKTLKSLPRPKVYGL